MTVKEVVAQAMRLVGRDETAERMMNAADLTDEETRLKKTFITYLNAVLDELARGYFPLTCVEDMSAEDGRFAFQLFTRPPVRIDKVKSGGRQVGWHICADYLVADAKDVTVYYEYAPPRLVEIDTFGYPAWEVSERLVSYGMAAEYCMVVGDMSAAQRWESKYRSEIELLLARASVHGSIPPRRWI